MASYKDDAPLSTIHRARAILNELDVLPTEHWFSQELGRCSVKLIASPPLQSLASGGKGANTDYALASAYGEFLERLQNYMIFPLFSYYEFDDSLRQSSGFSYDPAERSLPPCDLPRIIPQTHLRSYRLLDANGEMMDLDRFSFLLTDGHVNLVPFHNLVTETVSFVPFPLSYYLYGSNGMCAGNTPVEALVEGISEIIERYVNRRILIECINPPRVSSESVREFFPEQYEVIHSIEKDREWHIEVRDCSLGLGLPVMAVVLYQQDTGRYFVKLGAHPDLHVALGRALLELFQFRSPASFHDATRFTGLPDAGVVKGSTNLGSIFHNGAGIYPLEFFRSNESYAPAPARFSTSFVSNGDCLEFLVDIADSLGWELLVRDVGYLGFPAFQIVVPGISEINDIQPFDFVHYENQKTSRRVLKHLSTASAALVDTLRSTVELEISLGNGNGNLALMSRLPLSRESLLSKLDYPAILPLLKLRTGRLEPRGPWERAIHEETQQSSLRSAHLSAYLDCRDVYMNLLASGIDHTEAVKIVAKFHSPKVVDLVAQDCREAEACLTKTPQLTCPICEGCSQRNLCGYQDYRDLVKRLKSRHLDYADASGGIGKAGALRSAKSSLVVGETKAFGNHSALSG